MDKTRTSRSLKANQRLLACDTIMHIPAWHFILKIGTYVLVKDGDDTFVGQLVELDRACAQGRFLKIRKLNETYAYASFYKNHQISGVVKFPKKGVWQPVIDAKSYGDKPKLRSKNRKNPLYTERYVVNRK